MRQPTDPIKISRLKRYHIWLIQRFKLGKLKGKIKTLLKGKAKKIGIGVSTYYEKRNGT